MDAKLNHSDLSALLAKDAGMSLVKAELFTKTFFDLIIEGLEQDGVVKINGLGTFKITDVASRSSVNVNTGEKFEIKGHKKLVFTPADSLKDSVNQPFAMFEPVEVDETYSDDEEDNNELVAEENIVEDVVVEDAPVAEIESEPEAEEKTAKENVQAEESSPAVEETTETQPQQAEEQQSQETVTEQPVEPLVVQERPTEPVMVHVPKKEKKPFAIPEKKEKKKRTWLYVVFAVLFMLATLAVLFILHITPTETDDVRIDTVTRIEYKTDAVTEATVDATSGATPQDLELASNEVSLDTLVKEVAAPEEYRFVITEELAALDLKNITPADTLLYEMTGDWAEHKVVAHETLTRIALKYYGDKKLWPYIVKYNSLARPDDLCKGMKLIIPKLKPRN